MKLSLLLSQLRSSAKLSCKPAITFDLSTVPAFPQKSQFFKDLIIGEIIVRMIVHLQENKYVWKKDGIMITRRELNYRKIGQQLQKRIFSRPYQIHVKQNDAYIVFKVFLCTASPV